MKDTLYRNKASTIKPFEFDQHVVDIFPDMIKRSVPGYPMTVAMISVLADRYFQPHSNIYDLGCSLGAVSFMLNESLAGKKGTIVGVDSSGPMIAACNEKLKGRTQQMDMEFVCADILDTPISQASVVIMNFTLQFVPLEKRALLLQRIHDALLPGGVFILSEKIDFEQAREASLMQDLHHHMKAMNGYDAMEIANKREALEQVLLPETLDTHMQRLQETGFSQVFSWLRCLNFVSLLAIK